MISKRLMVSFTLMWLMFLTSCAPYVMIGGKYDGSAENFEVELPQGWRKHELAFDSLPASRVLLEELRKRREFKWDLVRITKDGLMLQQIAVGRMPLDTELSHIKKKFSEGLIPQEVAALILDDVRSNSELQNVELLENIPATVGGRPGFKLVFRYQTPKDLSVKVAYYGALVENWYYYLVYEAPEGYYFAKDYPTFEKVESTFRLVSPATN